MSETSKDSQSPDSKKSAKVITMGCRLNAYESDRIKALASNIGVTDTIVINSCAVTNEAVRHTRQAIRKAKRSDPNSKIVVTGCAAQIDPKQFSSMPDVDVVLGNEEKLNASEWQRIAESQTPQLRVNDIMSVRESAPNLIDTFGERSRAFLQIQTGCDHRCTFCIIPYGRGNSRSTPVSMIIEEAKRLVDNGFNELVLTGVDITSYGADLNGTPNLGDLVSCILDEVPSLFRLRLSSIDSAEIDDRLLESILFDTRVAPYLHLSLQSGDNMILKRMKRRHTREQAINFCHQLRQSRPDIAFGADLIVGFPTETDEMYANSLSLIDEADLSFIHVFPFSPREGTPAARMPQHNGEIIKRRASKMREKSKAALQKMMASMVGTIQDGILESGNRVRFGNFVDARLPDIALSKSPHKAGDIIKVEVLENKDETLWARPIKMPVSKESKIV